MEAAKLVAERVGIPFKWEGRGRWDNILEICETCAKYFHDVLLNKPEGERALHYLEGRGVDKETIKKFMLGFAPSDLKELLGLLKDYPSEDLEGCGIFSKREGKLHLILSGRIIFPISSPDGKIIAFGGRVLDDSTPKYINSWETALFRKGRILYGFHLAKKDIMEEKKAIIVEGYMDMIALYSAGIKNTVATLGTALTDEHLRLLKRYCEEIYLAFDADSPGMNAALRASPLIEEAGLKAKVILIPEGYDPDTFVRKEGKEAFEELEEKAIDIGDFRLKKALEKGDEGRKEAIEIISNISDPGKRSEMSKKLAEELAKGDPEMVREYLNWITLEVRKRRAGDRGKVGTTATSLTQPEDALAKMEKVEKELVRALLLEPSFITPVTEIIEEELFSNSLLKSIYSKIKSFAGGEFSRGALLDILEEEEKIKVSEIELEELPPPTEQVVYDCALKMLEIYLKRVGQINREALKLINEGKLARKKSIASLRSLFKTLQNLL